MLLKCFATAEWITASGDQSFLKQTSPCRVLGMDITPRKTGVNTVYEFRTGGSTKMAKNIQTKRMQSKDDADVVKWSALDANELKATVRDGLVGMNMTDREEFIGTLEAEMRRAGLNMRAYLVPLGIPGHSPEELTPTEVGHLIRFLKLNISKAMPAIERALGRYSSFVVQDGRTGHRIAA